MNLKWTSLFFAFASSSVRAIPASRPSSPPSFSKTAIEQELSYGWGGALFFSDKPVTSIVGTITIPELNVPPSHTPNSTFFGANAWIGLDFFNCSSYLRAGLNMSLSDGVPTWGLVYTFDDFFGEQITSASPLEVGDQIKFNVSVGTGTSDKLDPNIGNIAIEILGKDEHYTAEPDSSNPASSLCLGSASLYAERQDLRNIVLFKDLPDFGTLAFTEVSISLATGEKLPIDDPNYILNLDDGFTVTKTEVTSDSVTVVYDGLED